MSHSSIESSVVQKEKEKNVKEKDKDVLIIPELIVPALIMVFFKVFPY